MDCLCIHTDGETILKVIELSFVKDNLPIHEGTFNIYKSMQSHHHQRGTQVSD